MLATRVAIMIARGIITLVDDTKKCQAVQCEILDDEVADDVERTQPFGVSFRPPTKIECLIAAVGGMRDHSIVIGEMDRKYRPKGIEEHEGGLYYKGTFKVFIDKDGMLHLGEKSAAGKVARDDRVEAELTKIKTELGKIQTTLGSLTGQASFTTAYTNGYTSVADVGADGARVT